MISPFKKIKKTRKTQVIAEGLVVNDFIDKNVLKEIKKKFSNEQEVVTTVVQFRIVSKDKNGKIKDVDTINVEHPSSVFFDNKASAVSANKSAVLEKFLK